jgi:hypothetical protein
MVGRGPCVGVSALHSRWAGYVTVALGYTGLTCLFAWRVVDNLTTHIAGTGGDAWQNLWNMWWLQRALAAGENPYFTPLLHHPHGITLIFQTLNPFNGVLAMPFAALFGQPAAFNLVFLLSFVASGFFMYLLARDAGASAIAAFLAGAVFTFGPYHFAHGQGHMQLTAMEWVPCFLWLLRRAYRAPSWGAGLLVGLSLTLVTFCDLYYLVSCFVVVLAALVIELRQRPQRLRERPILEAAAVALVSFGLTGGLLVVGIAKGWLTTDVLPGHGSVYWAADLQAFFVPNWISAWGDGFAAISGAWTGNPAENSQYIGLTVLGLAGLSIRLWPPGARPWTWVGLAVLGVVLALGPYLHWGGTILHGVPLPFALLEDVLPFLKLSGAPTRWCFLTVVATSMLAGSGLTAVMHRFGSRRIGRVPAAPLVGVAISILVIVELAPRFVEVRRLAQPTFIEALAADPAPGAVYDLGGAGLALVRQMGHGRPMVGGYVSRITRQAKTFVETTPVLRALRGELSSTADAVREGAQAISLKFLIIPTRHPMRPKLGGLGLVRRFQDQGLEVWEISGAGSDQ